MHLVDDGPRGRPIKWRIAFPIIRVHICDHALHGCRRIVAGLPRSVATVVFWNNDAAPVRIEKNFGSIEARSTRGIERTVNSITVDLPCFYPRNENVPIVISPVDRGIDRDHTL